MKQEETPTALALVTKKVEPPLTKKELLRATAIAMAKKQRDARNEALRFRQMRHDSLERVAVSLAKKKLCSAKAVVNNIHYAKEPLSVLFSVDVERSTPEVAASLADYHAVQIPEIESEDTIYKRLQEASKAPERIMEMLKDAKFLKKLAEAGESMLKKPTEADKQNAIPA
jgi:hypothetical protein